MLTFAADGECEIDSLVLYHAYEERADRAVGSAGVAREAIHRSYGADYSWSPGQGPIGHPCERLGPFRRLVRKGVTTLYARGEYRTESGEPGWADARVKVLEQGGELPLRSKGALTRHSLDWRASLALVDVAGAVGLVPAQERDDESWLADLGYRICLANCGTGSTGASSRQDIWERLDLRFGAAYARHDSTITGLDFDRLVLTVGIEGRVGGWYAKLTKGKVGSGGVRVGPRTGQSGTTDPRTVPSGSD
jgi:hypothetical protein